MATMHVELVSPERKLWSGEAKSVFARTLEGELGILPGHAPLFGALVDGGLVRIDDESDESVTAAVRGGFLAVADNHVSVLAEWAELGSEVDVAAARAVVERGDSPDGDDEAAAEARLARTRLQAAGENV